MFGYYYDPTYILVLIGALLSLWASARVNSTYNKYAKVYSRSGLTGAEAAQQILKNAGIYGVRVNMSVEILLTTMIRKRKFFAFPTVFMAPAL